MTSWLKRLAVMFFLAVSCPACVSWFAEKPFSERQDMEQYAQERYLKGVDYMKQSRFELARQQFSTASATATSAALKEKARQGYLKANTIIEDRR